MIVKRSAISPLSTASLTIACCVYGFRLENLSLKPDGQRQKDFQLPSSLRGETVTAFPKILPGSADGNYHIRSHVRIELQTYICTWPQREKSAAYK